LCEDDAETFKEGLPEKAQDMNSAITPNAIYVAQELRESGKRTAAALLNAVGPDRSWLNRVAERIGIRIKNPHKSDELPARASKSLPTLVSPL
jgi:hypothetical protein